MMDAPWWKFLPKGSTGAEFGLGGEKSKDDKKNKKNKKVKGTKKELSSLKLAEAKGKAHGQKITRKDLPGACRPPWACTLGHQGGGGPWKIITQPHDLAS